MRFFASKAARLALAAVIAAGAAAVVPPASRAADKADPVFAKWWQKFQMAVMRRDVRSVDKNVEFPMDWQISEDVRAVRGESDLAANFNLFFTPEVSKNVATGKPEKLANGSYALTWKSNGKEYTMTFRYYSGTYVLDSLIEGKP